MIKEILEQDTQKIDKERCSYYTIIKSNCCILSTNYITRFLPYIAKNVDFKNYYIKNIFSLLEGD